MNIICCVESCKWNDNTDCTCPCGPTINDDMLTPAGFLPMCMDYEEKEGGGEDG